MPSAIGIIELSSIATGFQVQDVMLKSSQVDLAIARMICPGKYLIVVSGKGFLLVCGDVAAVKTAVDAGCYRIKNEGTLVNRVVITGVTKELFQEYI